MDTNLPGIMARASAHTPAGKIIPSIRYIGIRYIRGAKSRLEFARTCREIFTVRPALLFGVRRLIVLVEHRTNPRIVRRGTSYRRECL